MRVWTVGGALIEDDEDRVLLVRNRRRDGSHDWTTPGGVIEPGEAMLDGLTREVAEETGLVVVRWEGPIYTVHIEAPDLGWVLHVEAHRALRWEGDLMVDDPDGIVDDARFVEREACEAQLAGVARWFVEPFLSWLTGSHSPHFGYLAVGSDRASLVVTRR